MPGMEHTWDGVFLLSVLSLINKVLRPLSLSLCLSLCVSVCLSLFHILWEA